MAVGITHAGVQYAVDLFEEMLGAPEAASGKIESGRIIIVLVFLRLCCVRAQAVSVSPKASPSAATAIRSRKGVRMVCILEGLIELILSRTDGKTPRAPCGGGASGSSVSVCIVETALPTLGGRPIVVGGRFRRVSHQATGVSCSSVVSPAVRHWRHAAKRKPTISSTMAA